MAIALNVLWRELPDDGSGQERFNIKRLKSVLDEELNRPEINKNYQPKNIRNLFRAVGRTGPVFETHSKKK